MGFEDLLNNNPIGTHITQLNNIIQTSNNSCVSGTECYTKKQTKQLYEALIQAKTQLNNAPSQFKEAQKSYIEFTQGQPAYQQFQKDQLEKDATKYITELIDTFELYTRNAENNNIQFASSVDTSKYLDDVLLQLISSNNELKNTLEQTGNTIITNDRKTYYEREQYDTLKWWYKCWLWIYIFFLVIFTIAIFLANSDFSIMSKIGILILFIAYIFITKPIILFIIKILKLLYSFLPKNVYLSI